MERICTAVLVAAMLLTSSLALAGGTFEVIEEAGTWWFPGTYYLSQDGRTMSGNLEGPFYWTVDGGYQAYGPVVNSPGGLSGNGERIALATVGPNEERYPAVWSPTEGFILMDLIPGAAISGNSWGTGYDLNWDGTQGTGLAWLNAGRGTAFHWTEGVGSVILPSSGKSCRGTGISGDGRVVVGFDEHPVAGYRRPAYWVDDAGPYLIEGDTEALGECYEANSDGSSIVGWSDLQTYPNPAAAFLWNQDLGFINLGTLPGHESIGSYAIDVSDDNVVVGYSSDIHRGAPVAFIWTQERGMEPLKDYILDHDITGYNNENLYSAMSISGNGNVIAGNFIDPMTFWWKTFRLVLDDSATPVGDETPVAHAQLQGAVPNPFNPKTSVKFSLDRDQRVRLSVYDLSGNRVADLAHGEFSAGEHSVEWKGTDAGGREMPSGTYLVRLDSGGKTSTQKLTLVR